MCAPCRGLQVATAVAAHQDEVDAMIAIDHGQASPGYSPAPEVPSDSVQRPAAAIRWGQPWPSQANASVVDWTLSNGRASQWLSHCDPGHFRIGNRDSPGQLPGISIQHEEFQVNGTPFRS